MATAAFRSSTKRSAVVGSAEAGAEDAGSSTRDGSRRRARSLSRFPPASPAGSSEFPTPRSRFVNKVRGGGFPEISLDDLADEFFRAWEEEGTGPKGGFLRDDVSPRVDEGSSRPRGRSSSRRDEREVKAGSDSRSRRLRSVSVAARNRCSDSENDINLSHRSSIQTKLRSNLQQPSSRRPTSSGHVLRRSMSQKDLLRTHDSYSSNSSLTDDETHEASSNKNGTERTIRTVYAQEKTEHPTGDEESGLYEAMRKEVRNAVEEIRVQLEKVVVKADPASVISVEGCQSKSSDTVQVIAEIRRNCTSKLEQSEKRKQELLAELAAEEQRGQELTKIVRELLPEPKQTAISEKPLWSRRRSNDRTRMSKRLTEEAERYFEEFLSSVEDTDISSFDGERSDTSSTIGGTFKRREPVMFDTISETQSHLRKVADMPVESDGVVLPWLQWETSNDGSSPSDSNPKSSPLDSNPKSGALLESGNSLYAAAQESRSAIDKSNHLTSIGSWSLEGDVSSGSNKGNGDTGSSGYAGAKRSSFDMDEYLNIERDQELIFERLKQRRRIESGSLILCGRYMI